MTIKEMEEKTGMTRANIRFYEKEGLLEPGRLENGYRSYSQEDVRELQKLKLLRALGVPIAEIRLARQGSEDLTAVLARRQRELEQEARDRETASQVCSRMVGAAVRYDTLEPGPYLEALSGDLPPREDTLPRVEAPWRRFFARGFDLGFYSVVWDLLLTAVTRIRFWDQTPPVRILSLAGVLVLNFLLEPVFLHWFGATPGKWILGLRVRDRRGENLNWWDAFSRTYEVIRSGLGFQLPLWGLWTRWRSYRDLKQGEILPWEEASLLEDRGGGKLRAALYLPAQVLLTGAMLGLVLVQLTPDIRGELTVAEFSENFNQILWQTGGGTEAVLDAQGRWMHNADPNVVIFPEPTFDEWPQYAFELEDGRITAVTLELTRQGEEDWIFLESYGREAAVMAFVCSRPGVVLPWEDTRQVLRQLRLHPCGNWELSANGVRVTSRVEYADYADLSDRGLMLPVEGGEPYFHMEFRMVLEN